MPCRAAIAQNTSNTSTGIQMMAINESRKCDFTAFAVVKSLKLFAY